MKSLKWLWSSMLEEMSMRCDTDTHRDARTVSRRIKHEGLSYLTIALPSFCSDFEQALSRGEVGSDLFVGYKKRLGLPAFLQGFLSQVFDPGSGRLLGCPSTDAILCVRQFCLMWKKVNLPCTNSRTRRSIDAYIQVEEELRDHRCQLESHPALGRLSETAGIIGSMGLGRVHENVLNHSLRPSHGPGAVQERGIRSNSKFRSWYQSLPGKPEELAARGLRAILERGACRPESGAPVGAPAWHHRLSHHFPFDQYCVPNAGWLGGDDDFVLPKFLDPGAEPPVRVVTVPKTQKTPRIIAIEPVCMQYTQQALMRSMVDTIESSPILKGHVNFTDQSINQRLALQASLDGKHATLDLSEASDRVSLTLAAAMFDRFPELWEAIDACRSTRAELPDGRVIALEKFASMGSALCFPVESMVFFTICVLAGLQNANLPVSYRNISRIAAGIYVYGDDLIVPVTQVDTTIALLESFMLKVNTRKSHWTGRFRESCGVDAYDGVNVTPVYVRSLPPRSRQDVPEMLSFVSLANQLYLKGWWGTAALVREWCESILGPLPHVLDSSPCLGWRSVTNTYSISRWNEDLHRFEVKAPQVSSSMVSDPLEGVGALMKFLIRGGETPSHDGHLERSVRPGCARIKSRWGTPY